MKEQAEIRRSRESYAVKSFLFPFSNSFSYLIQHLHASTMSGSFIFYFHLVGFALVSALVISGWILNVRFISEKDRTMKMYVGGIMRTISLLSPIAALILLVTGIGNIYNLYYGTTTQWFQQGWLVTKIILFGVMVVNGMVFGPILSRKRMKALKLVMETAGKDEDVTQLNDLNKQMTWFYVVQSILLLAIVFFSAFGTSKHPGFY